MPTAVAERRTRSRLIGRRQYSCRSLATSSVSTSGRRERGLAPTVSPGALVLAAAIPVLFLHVHYQPGFGVGFGSTTVNAYLSDFAVLAVVAVAVWSGFRDGFGPLARGRWLWLAAGLFLVWMFVEVAYGRSHSSSYPWHTHGVTAAKFAEYALLAPALPLLIRRTRDLVLPLWSLAVWSALATIVGLAQFLGAEIFLAGTVGQAPGVVPLVGGLRRALRRRAARRDRRDRRAAASARPRARHGGDGERRPRDDPRRGDRVGARARRRRWSRSWSCSCCAARSTRAGSPSSPRAPRSSSSARSRSAAATSTRSSASSGRRPGSRCRTRRRSRRTRTAPCSHGSATRSGRTIRCSGSAGRARPSRRASCRTSPRRSGSFSDVSPSAFPSAAADRRYGVQNVWLQALADLGAIGLVLWVAVFAAAAWLAGRTAVRVGAATAFIGLAWTGLLVWLWTAQGYVAGIPLDALTWLAFGLRGDTAGGRMSDDRLHPSRTSVQYPVRRPLLDWLSSQQVAGPRDPRRRLRRPAVRAAARRRVAGSSASTSLGTPMPTCTGRSTRCRSMTRASTSSSASRCSSTCPIRPRRCASCAASSVRAAACSPRRTASTRSTRTRTTCGDGHTAASSDFSARMATGRRSPCTRGRGPPEPWPCSSPISSTCSASGRASARSAGPSSRALNGGGEAVDRAVPLLRQPVPGSLAANYHVEAIA